MNAEATRVRYLVVGMGLNVNQVNFPPSCARLRLRCGWRPGTSGRGWSSRRFAKIARPRVPRLVADAARDEAILRRFEQSSSSVRGRVRVEEERRLRGRHRGVG